MPHRRQTKPRSRGTLGSMMTLARWRWRESWLLLFITGVGMVAAIMVVCTLPLFTEVTTTAGLRGTLNAAPTNAELQLSTDVEGLSTQALHDVQQQLTPVFQRPLQQYLGSQVQFSIQIPDLTILAPHTAQEGDQMGVMGASMQQASSHISLLQGRLPQENSSTLETILTPANAASLHVQIGSLITLHFPTISTIGSTTEQAHNLNLRVVGLFAPSNDAYWHGSTFAPTQADQWTTYKALISSTALLNAMDTIAQANHSNDVLAELPYNLHWYYRLDPSRTSIQSIDTLMGQLTQVQANVTNKYGSQEHSSEPVTQYPYIQKVDVSGAPLDTADGPGILGQYSTRVSVAGIPVALLALQVIALILIFVSMMAQLLVDRQADAIAILRSRGASSRQVFGSLATQSVVLGLLAFLIGPLLALGVVYSIAQRLLPPSEQDALSTIMHNPLHSVLAIWQYAALAAIVAVIAMVVSLGRATRMDVLMMRRESGRSTHRALWQHLNLDIVAAIIALTGYGISLYITTIGDLLDSNTRAIVSTPLALVAPIFLLIAGVLLFLRIFPLILRLIARLAVRSRGAASLLAFAQMARAPRQILQMTLLLALTSAFAIFTLVFTASQVQRTLDISAYQAGADFSGSIAASNTSTVHSSQTNPLTAITAAYRHIQGVSAASAGNLTNGVSAGEAPVLHLQVEAVDTSTFAQTALWPTQASSQPLNTLMKELAGKRQLASVAHGVPVIVDAITAKTLALHTGSTFTVIPANADTTPISCMVIDTVEHIPTVNDSTVGSDTSAAQGGLLVDYQSYASIFAQQAHGAQLPVNHVWLHTMDEQASLASVRTALTTMPLRLNNLVDRRALLHTMQSDPLFLNLTGILSIRAATALFLALIGSLLASWSSARTRLTNFAVLRALGTAPRQVASILTWEQLIVYITAIVLGIIFGALLSVTVVPALVFTSVPISGVTSDLNNGTFLATQHVLPTQIIVPFSLGIAFIVLIVICSIVLAMMVRIVSKPSLSQALRINED